MEEKKAVAVLLGDDGTSINLVWGSNNIGRGNLAVSDKKVSRNHGTNFFVISNMNWLIYSQLLSCS